MGRLRDRRRGGGPARTLSGLNRQGAMQKVMGNRAGIQFPIVGEHDNGKEVVLSLDTIAVTEDIGRHSGVYLLDSDPYSGGAVPEALPATTQTVNWTVRGTTLIAWASGPCSATFWVY